MKKNELLEIIRSLVKEEINNALPQLLMEVLAEKMTENSSILESKRSEQSPRKSPNVFFEESTPKKQIQQPQKMFTKNAALNAVLNETVGGVPQEEESPTASAIDLIKNLPKETLNENKDVAAVANALTRDYSKLLKVVDAKAKAKRPV